MKALKLEDLCLRNITDNFTIFNSAYSTSNDASLQRNLEFLQRVYTIDLIKRLWEARQLTNEDYLKLLINKYLKELDFRKFRYCSWKKVLERIMKIAEGLVKVNLDAKIFRK
ncbi:hypothetical protein X975_19275, partial [Stegodyphus mimosarum]